jgi:hypothetical protein
MQMHVVAQLMPAYGIYGWTVVQIVTEPVCKLKMQGYNN